MTFGNFKKIAIVTGANGGIGFAICQRLLESGDENLTLVMACRNLTRANNAREKVLQQFPLAHIDIELVDLGSMKSVLFFSAAIKDKYSHVDYLFCNAGILSTCGLNCKDLFYLLFTDPVRLVEHSDAAHQIVGEINEDGFGKVFSANVLGHYIMMRELERLLSNSGDGRVIWASSITASKCKFDINDWQGIKSREPYESSKWACDLISVVSAERFAKEETRISSLSTSPGIVASSIGELPMWVTILRIILHYLMRILGVASQNINAYNGAIAAIYVVLQPLAELNYLYRYSSLSTRWGKAYVAAFPIEEFDHITGEKLVEKCELIYQAFKKNNATPTINQWA